MKPDKLTCKNCNKQIPRGIWCSDKCRKAYSRNSDKPEQKVGQKADIPKSDTKVGQLTKTDQTFYDRAMKDFGEPYYRFGGVLHEEECLFEPCRVKFKTTLSALRFCSYEHYKDALAGRGVKK